MVIGVLYLSLQAFPIIFGRHGFTEEFSGLSFLGLGVGLITATLSQPFWNRYGTYHTPPPIDELTGLCRLALKEIQEHGTIRPEFRLIMGQAGGVLMPIGLFWIAFTTYRSVHWIVPIIASIPFGMGILYSFTSTFTYLATAYQPIAASVLASNSFIRCCVGSVLPLLTPTMYDTLGTVGATALVGGLATLFAPLP